MNAAENLFTGFEDLGDDFATVEVNNEAPKTLEEASMGARPNSWKEPKLYREKCPKCAGTGLYRGPSSYGRACFACGGVGYKEYKSSPEQRAKSRAKAAEKRIEKIQKAEQYRGLKIQAFEAAHPDIIEWWTDNSFSFAQSLKDSLYRYGSLTENQIAAAKRAIENLAKHREKVAAQEAAAPTLDISGIEKAFEKAKDSGIKRPKMRLAGEGEEPLIVVVKEASANSRNAGSLYVLGDIYLGRITGGKFIKSRDCTDTEYGDILKMFEKPMESAVAYGRKTGQCSCCGRELTNHASIEMGIGPICAGKFFG
ncbi:hypothetical protein EPa61_85 [Pseudomonas phage EPa61]|uniref:Uncharacterized protein n=6 Tax=root TaxID=1 RepID=A0A6M4ERT4_9CAUD|nr:DUF6011 domain-containing protein [Pseudomonas phage EPa61]YP_009913667.1 DUF6011 domain-containing protein [Pseudomonas phage datas]AKF13671.1 hypothetical protein [Pseudomonas phage DL52]QJB23239.1 hypothetical protein billy_51 [Pseudomonas phage billy]QJQ84933.1 hypothetical protein Epa6_gp12 [Pseudomonas phage Epa6]AZV01701.1 hypothetical protein EPa61_85 [Pseudomonas phage EPa61]QIQ67848.1 hypothetical protein datas_9 [Pseudomonas phage datas]